MKQTENKIDSNPLKNELPNKTHKLIEFLLNTLAATLLAIMALIVSFKQCEISERQTNLINEQTTSLKKQTVLLDIQTRLTEEQLIRSRITDSLQMVIAQNQLVISDVQAKLQFTPKLTAYFGFNSFSKFEKVLFLKNEGKSDIVNIRIRTTQGQYFEFDQTYDVSMKYLSNFYWKKINILKPNQYEKILLDTMHINTSSRTSLYEDSIYAKSFEKFKYIHYPIIGYIIKYDSGPDLKENTIRKYLVVFIDSQSKNISYHDVEDFFGGKFARIIKEKDESQ